MKVSDEKNVYSLASKKARRETENKREKRGRMEKRQRECKRVGVGVGARTCVRSFVSEVKSNRSTFRDG